MGIVKISDELHDEIREASAVMSRSINAQAEFWIKVGRLAEENPTMTFTEIIAAERLRVKSLEQKRTEYAAGNDQNSQ
ncbi:ParD-like family protein [Pseudoalteromonas piscicida]|uniref:ParD-like antitoxin of type II toxin-antitoxin system n=1 Tax=Pseudoalteromonas piscicida TaxID=43662 RepID=A0A2A5JNJ1_PSEO7|nr:ParD-like family protein [Pseudoalteromonas piscicida]PCK30899.1 hypothetical protein CEX98_14845 [Pseudoalteromonas piscicida]